MTTNPTGATTIVGNTNGGIQNENGILSKKELKRRLKRNKILEERPAKREAERARKRAKKFNNSNQNYQQEQDTLHRPVPIQTVSKPTIFPSRVVFDCRFDNRMSDKEIVSLDRQICHAYAVNRRANVQFKTLVCTSFNGRLRNRFQSNGNQYLRWNSVKFTSESIEDLVPEQKKRIEGAENYDEKDQGEEEEGEEGEEPETKLSNEENMRNDDDDNSFCPSPSSSAEIAHQLTDFDNQQNILIDGRSIGSRLTHQNQEQPVVVVQEENKLHANEATEQNLPSESVNKTQDDNPPDQNQSNAPTLITGPSSSVHHLPHTTRDSLEFNDFDKSDLVYLTADSENILTTIDPNKVYIIGSIVDHNRYKNLCLNLSDRLQINHAQLPIGEYFSQLKTRKVLTVNQVFEILVRFLECKDWKTAFEKVIPSRKL